MRFIELAAGRWRVLLYVDEKGQCPVRDFLLSGIRGGEAMLSFLERTVSVSGVQYRNTDLVYPMTSERTKGLYEFRKQTKGAKLRVLFFADGAEIVVCATAFQKTNKTPPAQVRLAEDVKIEYERRRAAREPIVVEKEDSE